ncbi:unnamed protein product [Haemonchus placei]|uniref:Transposase n=1 Tax=Haemonchus placei TaxID=6290 RepID=A0A0N4WS81_HAEPC|nr:unnamed protein product [Haemonchus placei]
MKFVEGTFIETKNNNLKQKLRSRCAIFDVYKYWTGVFLCSSAAASVMRKAFKQLQLRGNDS